MKLPSSLIPSTATTPTPEPVAEVGPAPDVETGAPEPEDAPDVTKEAPEGATEAPEGATEAPEDATEAPEDATEAPEDDSDKVVFLSAKDLERTKTLRELKDLCADRNLSNVGKKGELAARLVAAQ